MIEYKDKVEIFDKNRVVIAQGDEKISLTQLWEVIVRTKRLPDGFDVSLLYAGVRDRLHDPEREVRQHALRVLIDLIPVTQQPALDNHMHPLLPDLLSNLGHTAPALRKSALDTLRIYLNHSRNSDQLLRDLIPATEVEEHLLAATPSLISPSTGDDTLGYILERLWDEIGEPGYKREVAAKALARIRCVLEDDRFRMLLGSERYAQLQKLCDSYGLPIQCYEGVSDTVLTQEEEEEDKVILETEITLRTGPAITMKIHEESRSGSEDGASQDMGVIKVLEDDFDSDLDDYEEARRTPRKVRFGGESVKMRTPESDSNQEDGVSTIRITLTDAVTIKTRKSLIPIRITSLPSTPKKRSPLVKPRLNQSTPNLSNAKSRSRIPLKKAVKFQATTDETFTAEPSSRQESNQSDTKKIPTRTTKKTKSRAGYLLSPTPIHNEIEVLHNLTRSPECGKTRRSPTPQAEVKEEVFQNLGQALVPYKASEACPKAQRGTERNSSEASVPYNSFQVCPDAQEPVKDAPSDALVPYKAPQTGPKAQRGTMEDSSQALIPNKISQTGPKAQKAAGDFYNSFQVCPDAQEPAKDAPSDALVPYKASQTGPKAQRGTMEDSSQALVPNKISQAGPKAQKAAGDFYNSFQVCPDAEQQGKNAPGGVMVPYNSFQVCPSSEESKPESSKASTTMQIESKEEEGTKTAYNSFKVFPNSRDASKENLSEMKDEDVVEEKPMNLHQPLEISSFSTEDELWNKSEALDNLIKMLKQPNTCESLEAGPAALLFEALFAYQHLDKLHFLADVRPINNLMTHNERTVTFQDALALLVKGLRQSVLEDCLGRVAVGLCKVGAPPGVGLALMIMKKCPAKKLQEEIMNKCFAHRTREGALQILMAAARLLPRGELEVEKMTEFAVAALRDRRRKVRHAALETLATLAQLSSNSDVLGTVNRIAEASQDRQYLLRVVRTRLSRRQLPSVEMDGTIRYSTPRDQAEVEWLTGVTVPTSPPSSSASSGTSVNYWKHNLRHEEDKSMSLPLQETQMLKKKLKMLQVMLWFLIRLSKYVHKTEKDTIENLSEALVLSKHVQMLKNQPNRI
ncbi:hypothetical protein NQ315_007776 [Exocentrus adspersus]|uniref:TOG domain-containing protein n=1 Tax=Exocentrus adspersus TaxID=1586481 RepID=A0AAV8W829_9CUCU|nr:hypothetical protein NQ315_007776 [Exocentrus adspersus]